MKSKYWLLRVKPIPLISQPQISKLIKSLKTNIHMYKTQNYSSINTKTRNIK